MKVPQPQFSNWFSNQLTAARITHSRLAERAGLSPSTINNLKAKKPGYSRHTISSVIAALGVKITVDELVASLQETTETLAVGKSTILEAPQAQGRRKRFWIPLVAAAVLVIAVSILLLQFPSAPAVDDVTRSEDWRQIELHLEGGGTSRIHVGDQILPPIRIRVGDENLIVTATNDEKTRIYPPGAVLVFDSTGTRRGVFPQYDEDFLDFEPRFKKASLSGIFQAGGVGAAQFFSPEQRFVWVWTNEATFALSRLSILDIETGKTPFSLWSWGRYYSGAIEDFDDDGVDEIAAIVVNNNFGKMATTVLNKPRNDFYLATVAYLEPEFGSNECLPGFYYRPECPTHSLRWLVSVPPYHRVASRVEGLERDGEAIVSVVSELGLYYFLTLDGQLHGVFAAHEWLRQHNPSHIPALVLMKVVSNEIQKAIIPACEDGEYHFDLVYSPDQIKTLLTLMEISMPLNNGVPTYLHKGKPITDIDN